MLSYYYLHPLINFNHCVKITQPQNEKLELKGQKMAHLVNKSCLISRKRFLMFVIQFN